MSTEERLRLLEKLVLNRQQPSGWVTPAVAAAVLGISKRTLVIMYDEGRLPAASAKQINASIQRRRLLFNMVLLMASIGGPVLA